MSNKTRHGSKRSQLDRKGDHGRIQCPSREKRQAKLLEKGEVLPMLARNVLKKHKVEEGRGCHQAGQGADCMAGGADCMAGGAAGFQAGQGACRAVGCRFLPGRQGVPLVAKQGVLLVQARGVGGGGGGGGLPLGRGCCWSQARCGGCRWAGGVAGRWAGGVAGHRQEVWGVLMGRGLQTRGVGGAAGQGVFAGCRQEVWGGGGLPLGRGCRRSAVCLHLAQSFPSSSIHA